MRVLGIDPGTVTMGYGVIDISEDKVTLLNYGALQVKERSPIGERLSFLYKGLMEIMAKYKPDAVAIEQPFVAANAKSALAIGRAQAIAILASANSKIAEFEYTPAQIKQQVANYGASSKEQIQEMVKLQLGLDEVPQPNDAADGLAVALCDVQAVHLKNLLRDS